MDAIQTILDHIDSGHYALPEFQRGYVWNREQVRSLFDSLYKKYPVGQLLVWSTESSTAIHRGGTNLPAGVVKLLLDGQQRITSLYGVIRGKPPEFFDGDSKAFTNLRFNLKTETFAFYQPVKMKDDPLWIDVTELMKSGLESINKKYPEIAKSYLQQIATLLAIKEIRINVEEVTGADKSVEVVVDIFNRANSKGTTLSKGDMALAKICADWPEARDSMKNKLKKWEEAGYSFDLDWLLRSINTVLTGEAKFRFLHDKKAQEIQEGLRRAITQIDKCLNLIANRLGLDHDRVLFAKLAIPVMVRYLDLRNGDLSEREQDKLLFWFLQVGMWGRFSGSTETYIDQDIEAFSEGKGGLDELLEKLRLWHGNLRIKPEHFEGWNRGARFYRVLYWLTRMGEARDWGTGLPLKASLLGRMSRLEVHHIFPKAQLYKQKYKKPDVNALANYCFLTKETNLDISNRLPEQYFPEIEEKHPGALASQWIPPDSNLWKIGEYPAFLEERKALLAQEANRQLAILLHNETGWLEEGDTIKQKTVIPGNITDENEEELLQTTNDWVKKQGLPHGTLAFEVSDSETKEQKAILDLAWPNGMQEGLSQPVALLLNEPPETLAVANQEDFRCFTSIEDFKNYVKKEILAEIGA